MGRILIADDSPTIHKVVQLTLASSGHDLQIASKPEELFNKLKSNEYDLVLLDFTLSDKDDGYALAKKINEINRTRILAMLGTFDSIDDNKMVEVGILDKIQKPFESQKFISLCNQLIETDISSFTANQAMESQTTEEGSSLDDDWIVNNQTQNIEESEPFESSLAEDSPQMSYESELDSWGVNLPGVIGKDRTGPIFPPIIEKTTPSMDLASMVEDDLAEDRNTFDFKAEDPNKNLSFASLDELAPEEDEWHSEVLDTSEKEKSSQQLMELSEVENDDFWAVDDAASLQSEEDEEVRNDLSPSQVETSKEQEEDFQFHIDVAPMKEEDLELPGQSLSSNEATSEAQVTFTNLNTDEIVEKVIEKLTPKLEELVQKLIASKVEEISWEVIPDLAENLIKTEIRRISESVTNSH